MALVNIIPFDTGDTSQAAATIGTPSVQSTIKRTGSHALRINPITTGTQAYLIGGISADGAIAAVQFSLATAFLRVYIRIATLPSAIEEIVRAEAGGSLKFRLAIGSDGKLRAYNKDGTLIGTASSGLSTGQWYLLELKIGTGASAAWEVKVDETSILSGTSNLLTSNNTGIYLGKVTNLNGSGYDIYFDDLSLRDDAFPGPGQVILFNPNANGSYNTWTIGAGSGEKWEQLDETPADDATTHLQSTLTVGNAYTAALENLGISGAINGVLALIRIGSEATGKSLGSAKLRLRSGSTDSDATARDTHETWQTLGKLLSTDPATGSPWLASALDSVEVGAVENSTSFRSRLSRVWLIVDYVPGTTHQAAATLSGQGSLAATPLRLTNIASALSGSGSISTTASVIRQVAAALSAAGQLSADVLIERLVAAALNASAVIVADPAAVWSAASSLSAIANLAAQGSLEANASVALNATGDLAVSPSLITSIAAALAGEAGINASVIRELLASSTLSAVAAIFATVGNVIEVDEMTLNAAASLAAEALLTLQTGADLASTGAIAGTPLLITPIASDLFGAGVLTADIIREFVAAASLAGTANLQAGAGYLLNLAAGLQGEAHLDATPELVMQMASLLQGSANLVASASREMLASAALSGIATLLASIGTQAIIITISALGGAAGKYIVVHPVLTSSGSVLYIEQIDTIATNGSVEITVPPDIDNRYQVSLRDGRAFPLATLGLSIGRNLGLAVLDEAEISGTLSTVTVSGNIYNLIGQPVNDLLIRVNRTCVDYDGNFLIPEPVKLPIDSSGFVEIDLIPTGDLYAPDGGEVRYEIVLDIPGYPIVGKQGFTVSPTATTFSAQDGSIITI